MPRPTYEPVIVLTVNGDAHDWCYAPIYGVGELHREDEGEINCTEAFEWAKEHLADFGATDLDGFEFGFRVGWAASNAGQTERSWGPSQDGLPAGFDDDLSERDYDDSRLLRARTALRALLDDWLDEREAVGGDKEQIEGL